MHAAPAVSYPVGASRLAAVLWLVGGALALLATIVWTLQAPVFGWRQQLGWVSLGACLVAVLWQWRHPEVGQLSWDGEAWCLATAEGRCLRGSVRPVIDLQGSMLLRLEAAGPPAAGAWLWLERRAEPARWDALRRAVYSPARTGAPNAAQPPSAPP